jgi:hypothetical protein
VIRDRDRLVTGGPICERKTPGRRQPEWGPRVDTGSPRTIILVGALGPFEMMSIANYCHRLHRSGQTELHLDMNAVTDCHRAGLDGLQALAAGSSNMAVSIDGANWGQFRTLLRTAPVLDVQDLCDSVRALVDGAPPSVVDAASGPALE